ncbi:MAG TPA: amidohydrolase family protein, partial [Bacteroidia bacterium]|nr:amidohydrolase family protein [Bacteroidia bacterium]
MRHITADYIFPISSPPIKNGIIVIDDDGTIIEIRKSETNNSKSEIYKGIICPGLINVHCHLELSHMKGVIAECTGLSGFIGEFLRKRKQIGEENIQEKIVEAEKEMINSGIVAVGDISNNDLTFSQKGKGNLFYHTFIELFDLVPEKAKEIFANGKKLHPSLGGINFKLQTSLTPHAPYSVSHDLLNMIRNDAIENKSLLSIHNQETESENELFKNRTGNLVEFFKSMNINLEHLPMTGKSSLASYLPLLPKENKILLVHNTFTKKEDIQFAHNYSTNIYWCFCPNANLYIENSLPDLKNFIDENAKCCVGTDSYASNWSLSILDELKTITKYTAEIPLQTLLKWATLNGAEFFGIENQYGSIEKNKKPGLNLIENVDLENL